jgi:hypothetical protein
VLEMKVSKCRGNLHQTSTKFIISHFTFFSMEHGA